VVAEGQIVLEVQEMVVLVEVVEEELIVLLELELQDKETMAVQETMAVVAAVVPARLVQVVLTEDLLEQASIHQSLAPILPMLVVDLAEDMLVLQGLHLLAVLAEVGKEEMQMHQATELLELLKQVEEVEVQEVPHHQMHRVAQAALASSYSNINKSIMRQQFGLSTDLAHGCVQIASMRSIIWLLLAAVEVEGLSLPQKKVVAPAQEVF
jgi:hypothetical protein